MSEQSWRIPGHEGLATLQYAEKLVSLVAEGNYGQPVDVPDPEADLMDRYTRLIQPGNTANAWLLFRTRVSTAGTGHALADNALHPSLGSVYSGEVPDPAGFYRSMQVQLVGKLCVPARGELPPYRTVYRFYKVAGMIADKTVAVAGLGVITQWQRRRRKPSGEHSMMSIPGINWLQKQVQERLPN
jgi:hypothetical protein